MRRWENYQIPTIRTGLNRRDIKSASDITVEAINEEDSTLRDYCLSLASSSLATAADAGRPRLFRPGPRGMQKIHADLSDSQLVDVVVRSLQHSEVM